MRLGSSPCSHRPKAHVCPLNFGACRGLLLCQKPPHHRHHCSASGFPQHDGPESITRGLRPRTVSGQHRFLHTKKRATIHQGGRELPSDPQILLQNPPSLQQGCTQIASRPPSSPQLSPAAYTRSPQPAENVQVWFTRPGRPATLALMEAACFAAETNSSKAKPKCAHTPVAAAL